VARYTIKYDREAEGDLDFYGRKVEALVRAAIRRYLSDQPLPPVGQRKALDANPLGAPFRLRVSNYRAFYRVDEARQVVYVLRVGYKPGETLSLRGQPIPMRD
jgi:mRNA-degrading endonuclease RelE of RelBE toxin-antitoxin system